jgi:hypothetical protein
MRVSKDDNCERKDSNGGNLLGGEVGRGIPEIVSLWAENPSDLCHWPTDCPEKLSVADEDPRVEDECACKEGRYRGVW